MILKRFFPTALLAALALLALGLYPSVLEAQNKKVVVHIGQYSNDLHSPAMGMGIANAMVDEGADVTVFLDREGVRMVDAGQPFLIYGDTDVGNLYREFVAKGGKILVCPHCAMLAGVGPENLREGAVMGTPQSVARLIIDADVVLDY